MRQTVRTGYGVDTRDFKLLAKALRTAQAELYAELHAELREMGQIVADEAKAIVSPYSETIPASIKVNVRGASVSVIAGGGGMEKPIAGLFELGNKRGGSKSAALTSRKQFRHPVYGNREVWVNQPMHPFLEPALQKQLPMVEARVTATLDRAARTITYDYLGGS